MPRRPRRPAPSDDSAHSSRPAVSRSPRHLRAYSEAVRRRRGRAQDRAAGGDPMRGWSASASTSAGRACRCSASSTRQEASWRRRPTPATADLLADADLVVTDVGRWSARDHRSDHRRLGHRAVSVTRSAWPAVRRCRGRGQRVHPAGAVRVDRQPWLPGEDADAAGAGSRVGRRGVAAVAGGPAPARTGGESSTSPRSGMMHDGGSRSRPARSRTQPVRAARILDRATSDGSRVSRSRQQFPLPILIDRADLLTTHGSFAGAESAARVPRDG